jgi:hypothetical protein
VVYPVVRLAETSGVAKCTPVEWNTYLNEKSEDVERLLETIACFTHVDLRSRRALREIPFNRAIGANVCAGATIKIGLIVCLQVIVFSGYQISKVIPTQDDQEPA